MQTLEAPVFEVKQDSEWYKSVVKRNLLIEEFFEKINSEYFKDKGFSFYHSEYFGVQGDSADYETYKDEVTKNPNKDGVHIFKKRSKYFQTFKELLEPIGDSNPFMSHKILGLNNISGSHWVGDRWFFGVKHEQYVKGKEVAAIDYKEYLKVVLSYLT